MKFEHLLKIYWSRGLYFNGRLYKLNWTLREMFDNLAGLAKKTRFNFIKRFEFGFFFKKSYKKKLFFYKYDRWSQKNHKYVYVSIN